MVSASVNISNIKISLTCECNEDILRKYAQEQPENIVHRPITKSFFLFRLKIDNHDVVITIYYKGHINVTGIKKLSEISILWSIIGEIPGIIKANKIKVDNITATSKLEVGNLRKQKYSFERILQLIEQSDEIKCVQYSSIKFPGAFIRVKQRGTLVLFPSGKFNILGCAKFSEITQLENLLNGIITDFILFN